MFTVIFTIGLAAVGAVAGAMVDDSKKGRSMNETHKTNIKDYSDIINYAQKQIGKKK